MKSRKLTRLAPAAWLVAAIVWSSAAMADNEPAAEPTPTITQPTPAPDEIAAWIGELDDNRYLVRERATRQLLAAGSGGLDALLAAANGGGPEPADRAVWILRRLGNSKDLELRRQALERLISVQNRPQVAAAARLALAEILHHEAVQAIQQLGGRFVTGQFEAVGPYLAGDLILDHRWTGGDAGLRHLRFVFGLRAVKIIGADVSAAGLTELQQVETLEELWLIGTKLEPEDVPKVQKLLPEVMIDFRRGALLGVSSSTLDGMGAAVVGRVENGSAAAAAGIRVGDIIHKFAGEPVANFKALTTKISNHRPGDEVTIEVLRDGKPIEFKIKLGQWRTI